MLVFTFPTSLLSFIYLNYLPIFFFLKKDRTVLMNIKSVVLLSILRVIWFFSTKCFALSRWNMTVQVGIVLRNTVVVSN